MILAEEPKAAPLDAYWAIDLRFDNSASPRVTRMGLGVLALSTIVDASSTSVRRLTSKVLNAKI